MRTAITLCIFLFVSLLSVNGFASPGLPSNLECRDLRTDLGVFYIYDFDKESQLTVLGGARGVPLELTRHTITLYASNECDNDYTFKFTRAAIRQLAEGKRSSVIGRLKYTNSEVAYEHPGVEFLTTTVLCSEITTP